ncbi:TPA: hypothetical protein KQF34_002356 [Clostridioides difficile]|uniref:hypothetical protein n=1 Tax=Clostridioides difficile TaxID=1496 RepID=UPI001C1C785B|nr:hypothetical protein [Clostridioides difficile]HBG4972577.1 hypothetical protein [Clostridioides difficile]
MDNNINKKELFKKVEGRLHHYKFLNAEIKNLELDIESKENEIFGCKAIGYGEKVSPTYAFNSSVEDEVIKKERDISRLKKIKKDKEIEKKKIENALTCLDIREEHFFKLFYDSKTKNSMVYISLKMNLDEKTCRCTRNLLVYKIMDMLYPKLRESELPLFKN